MPLKIVRNDITKMQVDAIVNTANQKPLYASGIDAAVYHAAGEEQLLEERRKIGCLKEGDAVITPGFQLPARYIIHAVSPRYRNGFFNEEKRLRSCYRKSLELAQQYQCKSVAFPLIATGNFGYPKEEGMRIALDEINAFLLQRNMLIYLVVFDAESTKLGQKLYPKLEAYIDQHYVSHKREEEYGCPRFNRPQRCVREASPDYSAFLEENERALRERMKHLSDTFQEYFMYLIQSRHMSNSEVYKRALVTKQLFSKIKLNKAYHPDKATAMRLCVGARLSLDETKDLLARAGYALSPCDKRDIIFSFFIENGVYDMIEIDIALEEHGLPCFIE